MRERRRKRQVRVFLLGFALFVAVAAGLVYLIQSDSLKISTIEISGTKLIDPALARKVALDSLQGEYFHLVPKSSSLFYSRKSIAERFAADFPEFESVSIRRSGIKTIRLEIAEKKPYALWCGDVPEMPAPECLFLDEKGATFSAAPEFSTPIYFKYFGKLAKPGLPGEFLTPAKFAQFSRFASLIIPTFPARKALATSDGDYKFLTDRGTALLASNSQDGALLAAHLKLFLDDGALGAARNNPDAFEYIDLRFGNKVYYKLRQP